MPKPIDKTRLELITLAAFAHGEISIGCAREVLGWADAKIRAQAEKRFTSAVKQQEYIEKLERDASPPMMDLDGVEVWCEEPGLRVQFSRAPPHYVVIRFQFGECIQISGTVSPHRWERIVAILSPAPNDQG